MKYSPAILAGLLMWGGVSVCPATPGLDSEVDLGIDVGSRSAPTFSDWDNDSRKDMVVGQYSDSKIRVYMNEGTDENPAFASYDYLEAVGVDITAPFC